MLQSLPKWLERFCKILSTLLSLHFSLTKCCVTVVIVSNHLQVDCKYVCRSVLSSRHNIVWGRCYSLHPRAVYLEMPLKILYCILLPKFCCSPLFTTIAGFVFLVDLIYTTKTGTLLSQMQKKWACSRAWPT